eukprot:SAG22_NODE_475_length_10003_cov_3.943356_5_plen_121_part_00
MCDGRAPAPAHGTTFTYLFVVHAQEFGSFSRIQAAAGDEMTHQAKLPALAERAVDLDQVWVRPSLPPVQGIGAGRRCQTSGKRHDKKDPAKVQKCQTSGMRHDKKDPAKVHKPCLPRTHR